MGYRPWGHKELDATSLAYCLHSITQGRKARIISPSSFTTDLSLY